MIKIISFDFWHTLYSEPNRIIELQAYQNLLSQLTGTSPPLDKIGEAFLMARKAWADMWIAQCRSLGAAALLPLALKHLDISLSQEQMRIAVEQSEASILNNPPGLFEDAKVVLPKLAERYRLAIISDTDIAPGRVLSQILEADGIRQYFNHFTYSDEIGSCKPLSINFMSTVTALNAKPSEAVHVGDMIRSDIVGAKRVGMRAVQYIGEHHDKDDGDIQPDTVINDHRDLVGLLESWEQNT